MTLGTALSVGMAALVWVDARFDYAPCWLVLCLLAAAAGSWEYTGLARARGLKPGRWLVAIGCAAVVGAHWADGFAVLPCPVAGVGWLPAVLVLWTAVAMVGVVFRFRPADRPVDSLAAGVLTVVYLGLFLGFALRIRLLPEVGVAAVVLFVATVKSGDIFAYLTGKTIGRHPMAPVVSPKKTIEGSIGGLAGSVGAALAVCACWRPEGRPVLEPAMAVVFGLVVGAAGQLGDLVESVAKRDTGLKDSGGTLSAFGGVLDMLDSLLLAAPAAYAILALGGNA